MNAPSPPTPTCRQKGAFTLLELMIVIGLVALLCVLTLPALQRMRERSNVVVCTASLRDFYVTLSLYAADHSGKLPPAIASGHATTYWRRSLLPYWQLPSEVEAMSRTPLRCPAVERTMREEYHGTQGNEHFIPYALNYYLSNVRIAAINDPASKLLATEAPMRPGNLPNETVNLNLLLNYGRDYHAGSQNLLFADGHVEPFRNIRRLSAIPYSLEGEQNIWTP